MIDLPSAVLPGAPSIWDAVPGNACFTLRIGDAAACEKAFAAASHRVRLRLVNNRVTASSMEPRGAIGQYNSAEVSFTPARKIPIGYEKRWLSLFSEFPSPNCASSAQTWAADLG